VAFTSTREGWSLEPGNHNSPAFRLDRKVAVVTGAASGIGRSIALKFAAQGACVRILDIDGEGGQHVAREILDGGGSAQFCYCDVGDRDQVNSVFSELLSHGSLNILVNNAGIAHVGNLERTAESDFVRIFDVNVKGFYHCMVAAVRPMKTNGGGVILNVASIAATAGISDRFAYSMSKGAVLAMTNSVARDYLPHKIRCNCISPARVHTPFVDNFIRQNYAGREQEMFEKLARSQPIGRMAEPEEVASLALFLCSDEASFITGSNYPIDGGFLNLHG
jgi:NAD(P)-dependent dehydrogenase (short-subunit alcohol dehydrogenase family)